MDTTEAGRSMLTGEIEATSPKAGSSRSLWAVSMCSLVAVASLSAVLYADRTRIAQLEQELNNSHEVLSRPEVMQRVLALAQVDGASIEASGSSTSISGGSASISGGSASAGGASASGSISGGSSSSSFSGSSTSFEASQSSSSSSSTATSVDAKADISYSSHTSVDINISGAKMSEHTFKEDLQIIHDFSASLHDTLMRLNKKIVEIDVEWQTSQADFTHLEADVDILIKETDQIKIDVTTLMNNYDDLYIDIQAQQVQIDVIEGIIDQGGDAATKLDARLTKIEKHTTEINVDIDALQQDTTDIEANVTIIKNNEKDLDVKVTDLDVRVEDIELALGQAGAGGIAIDARITKLEQSSKDINVEIKDIQNTEVDIQADVKSLSVEVDGLEGQLDGGKSTIVEINNRITKIEADTKTLTLDLDYEYQQTNNLNIQVRSLQTNAKDLSARLTLVESN